MTINPDDTLQSCLNRILQSGDVKEPLAQFLAQVLQEFGGGGGAPSAPSSDGNAVQKTGDSMSGPLAIATAAQPELHVADAAGGVQTLDVNNSGLTLKDSSVGNSVRVTLAQVLVQGSGAEIGASANRTTIGVNYLGLGHKSWSQGNSPVSFYQSNQGELFIQFTTGQNYRVSDFAHSRFVVPTDSLSMISPDGGSAATLSLANGGEIVATATAGPNAGKSVNLTTGKWV